VCPAGEGYFEKVAPVRFSAIEPMDIGMDLGGALHAETKESFSDFPNVQHLILSIGVLSECGLTTWAGSGK
jgi:hypothetical protein